MSRIATSPDEFLEILCERHRVILAGRPSSGPGRFKTCDNRAGNTHFVSFDRVRGTLKKGVEMSRVIRHPFARAVFVLLVTSEVHPFADGNGRISRIMMNAELTAAGQAKIIVPTVFRHDYIGALRRLSRNAEPGFLLKPWADSGNLAGGCPTMILRPCVGNLNLPTSFRTTIRPFFASDGFLVKDGDFTATAKR